MSSADLHHPASSSSSYARSSPHCVMLLTPTQPLSCPGLLAAIPARPLHGVPCTAPLNVDAGDVQEAPAPPPSADAKPAPRATVADAVTSTSDQRDVSTSGPSFLGALSGGHGTHSCAGMPLHRNVCRIAGRGKHLVQ
jgi:hypothetical protein